VLIREKVRKTRKQKEEDKTTVLVSPRIESACSWEHRTTQVYHKVKFCSRTYALTSLAMCADPGDLMHIVSSRPRAIDLCCGRPVLVDVQRAGKDPLSPLRILDAAFDKTQIVM
jgi:hypothetical protein